MTPYTGMFDILLGYDTDLHFENGDLMVTTGLDYIEREVFKLLITEPGDWKATPKLGCSPNIFSGAQNTKENAKKIENYLLQGLTKTVSPAIPKVRVIPTGYESVMIFIDIIIQNYEVDSIPFEFDFINGIKKFNKYDYRTTEPKSSNKHKLNDNVNMKKSNKYLSSMRDSFIV